MVWGVGQASEVDDSEASVWEATGAATAGEVVAGRR